MFVLPVVLDYIFFFTSPLGVWFPLSLDICLEATIWWTLRGSSIVIAGFSFRVTDGLVDNRGLTSLVKGKEGNISGVGVRGLLLRLERLLPQVRKPTENPRVQSFQHQWDQTHSHPKL